ncbi:MAG: LON peptidase substrate-binding domain-containing protein [Pseudomonadota bacterium]
MNDEIPLFPLNTVIFPDGLIPLRIFETRYLDMVRDCARHDTGFGIVLTKPKTQKESTSIHKIGTFCTISDWERLSDGLLGITAVGQKRFEIKTQSLLENSLSIGQVSYLKEMQETPLPDEFSNFKSLLSDIIDKVGVLYADTKKRYSDAGWVGARLIEFLPIDISIKQNLLEIDDYMVRLYHLKDEINKNGYHRVKKG